MREFLNCFSGHEDEVGNIGSGRELFWVNCEIFNTYVPISSKIDKAVFIIVTGCVLKTFYWSSGSRWNTVIGNLAFILTEIPECGGSICI